MFNDPNTFEFLCFLAFASKWPRLMQFWTDAEQKLPSFRNSKQKRSFIFKIRFTAFGFLTLALCNWTIFKIFIKAIVLDNNFSFHISVEHTLCVVSHVHYILTCQRGKDPILEHINRYIPFLYTNADRIPIPEAILVKSISIIVTFVWNYLDVFIMTIGIALSFQFKLYNDDLERAKGGVSVRLLWKKDSLKNSHLYSISLQHSGPIAVYNIQNYVNW